MEVEISKKQFEDLFEEYFCYAAPGGITKTLMKALRATADYATDEMDWTPIAKFVNKQLKKQEKKWSE